ncbi:hypothetical protein KNE206_79170 [Kitasatospora sp. NE20-6]
MTVEQVESWSEGIAGFHARFARHFGRSEPRERALDYLNGLLAPLERKNGWVRHEALCDRVEVRNLYRRAVAAVG